MRDRGPGLIIVAGANGLGETTFAVPYTEQIGVQFLNADQFARTYADRGEDNAMIKGGRAFFRRLNGALDRLEDVVIETTLSGTYTSKVVDSTFLKDNFTNISDVWFLYYNGVHGFEPVAENENGLLEIISPILHAEFNDIG